MFIDLKPVKRFEKRRDMIGLGVPTTAPVTKFWVVLKTIYLRIW